MKIMSNIECLPYVLLNVLHMIISFNTANIPVGRYYCVVLIFQMATQSLVGLSD